MKIEMKGGNKKMKKLLVTTIALFAVLMISVVSASAYCPWDVDGNGFVNPADRSFVRANLGCRVQDGNVECKNADVDNNLIVTPADIGHVMANMGTVCPIPAEGNGNGRPIEPDQSEGSTGYQNYKTLGALNAPVTIDAFVAFDEPFSARWYTETFPQIKETFIEGGHVKINFRHYPLSFNPNMLAGALASECAAKQDMFFPYADSLFNAKYNEGNSGVELNANDFRNVAEKLGLDMKQFDNCIVDSDTMNVIEEDISKGTLAGVSGVPTFFINGEIITGSASYNSFAEVIMSAGNYEGLPDDEPDRGRSADIIVVEPINAKPKEKIIVEPKVEDNTQEEQTIEDLQARITELENRVEKQESVLNRILKMLGNLFGSNGK